MFSKCSDGKSFIVCGPVARDAEYKTVGEKNSSLTKFSVKCDEKEETDGNTTAVWTNCECWHSVARHVAQIKKGDTVLAIGVIKNETWTDKNTGVQKQAKKLVCDFVAILPYSSTSNNAPAAQPPKTAPQGKNVRVEMDDTDEEYPF